MDDKKFTFIAEVPIAHNELTEPILKKANALLETGFDMLAFPDRARNDDEVATMANLVNLNIFSSLPPEKLLPIVTTRNKTKDELINIFHSLKAQGAKNIFIVTGDTRKASRTNFLSSIEMLPWAVNDFTVGAVAHPDIASLPRDGLKINAGASFLIAQATYNLSDWRDWIAQAKKLNFHENGKIFQAVIPIINQKMLSNLERLAGVDVPSDFFLKLAPYSDEKLKEYGIKMARDMISEIRNSDFFSGVYLYSKDFEVLRHLLIETPAEAQNQL